MHAYERYGRALIRKAERILRNREDARDMVHTLFVDLLEHDERALDLPYLYRAITNRCLTYLRDEKNRARLLAAHDDSLGVPARTRCEERTIDMDVLVKLVRLLDDETAQVLAYRYLDDMTQEEIATMMGLSRKTIGKRLDAIREAVVGLDPPARGGAS
jgi:RNA polymerase sigma-70 factor (ECF subfamily)